MFSQNLRKSHLYFVKKICLCHSSNHFITGGRAEHMSQKWWYIKASTSNPIFFNRKKKSNKKPQPFQYVICKIDAKGFLL